MLTCITSPWYYKFAILLYDIFVSSISVHSSTGGKSTNDIISLYHIAFNVYILHCLFIGALIIPSLFLSVKSRQKTNFYVAQIFTLLIIQAGILMTVYRRLIPVDLMCYCLQFSLCYTMYCLWSNASNYPSLLVGGGLLKPVFFVSIFICPLVFTHAVNKGMHLSPYILPIFFTGEICGLLSMIIVEVLRWCLAFLDVSFLFY